MVFYHTWCHGFSRSPVSLECITNNKAETILNCFLKGVKCYGIPSRVRSEEGMENDFMIEKGEVLVKV